MKESILEVLLYLFEHHISAGNANKLNEDELELELEKVGFLLLEIHKALDWLENMTMISNNLIEESSHHRTMRIFNDVEQKLLDVRCRGYLLFLEQVRILDVKTREIVVERVLALDEGKIDLDQIKCVVFMVLFYRPGCELAYSWMEDLIFNDTEIIIH